MQQLLLGVGHDLELIGHAVAILGKVDNFVTSPPHIGLHSCIESTSGDLAHRLAQLHQRRNQVAAEEPAEQRAHERAGDQRVDMGRPLIIKIRTKGGADVHGRALPGAHSHLEIRSVHRLASQQTTLIIVKPDPILPIRLPDIKQRPPGRNAGLLQKADFVVEHGTERRVAGAGTGKDEQARSHQKRQAGRQPEGQKQLPEQPARPHGVINM